MDAGHLTLFGFQMTKSCNFQNLIVLGFPETSQNLMSLRQLLFSLFHVGDQRKKIWKRQKASNVRHPYLRILFPFVIERVVHIHIFSTDMAIHGVLQKQTEIMCTSMDFKVTVMLKNVHLRMKSRIFPTFWKKQQNLPVFLHVAQIQPFWKVCRYILISLNQKV